MFQPFETLIGFPDKDVVRVELLYRALLETDAMRIAAVEFPDMAGMMSPQSLFRVTGKVAVAVYAMVQDDIEAASSLGPELVVNGGFDGNADAWTLGDGWSYSADAVHMIDPGDGGALVQDEFNHPVEEHSYQVEFDITGTSGSVDFNIGGGWAGDTNVGFDVGHYTGVVQSGNSASLINVFASSEFFGSLDNISVREMVGSTVRMSVGIEEDLEKFLVFDLPLVAANGALWITDHQLEPGQDIVPSDPFYLRDQDIKLFLDDPEVELAGGAMSVQVLWWALEPGAMVEPIQ